MTTSTVSRSLLASDGRFRGPKLRGLGRRNRLSHPMMKPDYLRSSYDRTYLRRVESSTGNTGKASGQETQRNAGIPSGRKRRSQRVRAGALPGDAVLRTVEPAAGCVRRPENFSGREQEQTEIERELTRARLICPPKTFSVCLRRHLTNEWHMALIRISSAKCGCRLARDRFRLC